MLKTGVKKLRISFFI